jgi:acyl carrier protein
MKAIERQVRELVASVLDIGTGDIRPDSTWDDYGADSLAVVELVYALEQHFALSFEMADLETVRNVADIVRVIEGKVEAASRP